MRTAYEGVFAVLFKWSLARWRGDADMASFMIAMGLGYMGSLNGMVILWSVVALHGPLHGGVYWVLDWILVLPIAIAYVAFVRRNRYIDIVRRFNERPLSEQRRRSVIAWTYVSLSVVARLLT